MQDDQFTSGLQRMSEFKHYEVSEEDPDPRGWTVVTRDGTRIGEVKDLLVDPDALKVRFFEVELDEDRRGGDRRVLVDAYTADVLERDKRVVVDSDVTTLAAAGRAADYEPAVGHDRGMTADPALRDGGEAARLTRSEEELRIGKRQVEAGEVVVNKTVDTEHVRQPVERRIERVRVERRPVEARSTGDVEISSGEVRVPIVEEEVVVEKRPVVKEEIVVTRDVETEADVVEADVRKERVDVREEGTKPRGGRYDRH